VFAAQHQYMTVIGGLYSGPETWQFGLRITDGGVSNEVTALAIAPIVEAWWRGTGYTGLDEYGPSSYIKLTELKVARIRPDGTYPPAEVAYSHFYLPPIVGGIVGFPAPHAQLTTCITLTTAVPRGLASKGRIYLPASSKMVDIAAADGRMTQNNANVLAASVARLIASINANAVVGNVQVMSKGKGVPVDNPAKHRYDYTFPNPGVSNNVTGTRCGRVVDTQRRRRRSMIEAPEVATVP